MRKKLENPINFQYYIDVSYNTEYHCENNGCSDEGICRCSTLEDIEILTVDRTAIFSCVKKHFGLPYEKDDFDIEEEDYLLDRLLEVLGAYSPVYYDVATSHSYYGEEIDSVNFGKEGLLRQYLAQLKSLNFSDSIRFLLQLEYDTLLEELETCNFKIVEISTDLIRFGSPGQMTKANKELDGRYSKWNLPCGIVKQDGEHYRVIDGYHRILANQEKKTIKVIQVEGT